MRRKWWKSAFIMCAAAVSGAHSSNAQNIDKVLFQNIQPTNHIWVSADIAAGGNGSREHPFNTIQEAVDASTAGTAIMVKRGEYHENIKLPTNSPGTAKAPVWLISADGPEAANIVARSNQMSTLYGYGTDDFVVKDFRIEGGKNGIQFSQSGANFTNMVENIVVEGNTVLNTGQDGIKIDQANNVQILGNTVHSTGQESIDFVAVNNSLVAYNEVSDALGAGGIMIKGGSTNVTVKANSVHDIPKTDGIVVGGWTGDQFFVPGFTGYEAKNLTVTDNDVRRVAKRPVNILGVLDSHVFHNYLEANVSYYTAVNVGEGYPKARTIAHSGNIEINHNIIANRVKLTVSPASNNNISFHDNNPTGVWDVQTGPAAFRATTARVR